MRFYCQADGKEFLFMLIRLALAPVLIILCYIFFRDKYEKEPLYLLFTGVLFGIIISFPILFFENFIDKFSPSGGNAEAFFNAFFVASFVEEFFKFIVLFFLIRKNNNFNEPFDGIAYCVFISLGFAGFENVLYVINPQMGGIETAFLRAIFSVPGHALFAVFMGYYFSLSKFIPEKKKIMLVLSFAVPFLLHGVYDFILLADIPLYFIPFGIFTVFLWLGGFIKMKKHLKVSPFKKN